MGLEQILDLPWDKFYWPRMTKDAELHIVRCDECICFKSKPQKRAMENIQTTHMLQLVHLDYLMIKATKGGKDVHVSNSGSFYTICASSGNIIADCSLHSASFMGLICSLLESIVSNQC